MVLSDLVGLFGGKNNLLLIFSKIDWTGGYKIGKSDSVNTNALMQ